ncbi:MAG: hypothetical protein ACRDF4_05710, partial [Rhabdochlamydiaceae bacterium]
MIEQDSYDWACRITGTVFDLWKSDFPFWRDGIKTFYTPVKRKPDLVIVTLNPGSSTQYNYEKEDKERFEIRHDFAPPFENEYLVSSGGIPRSLRSFFRDNMKLLAQCVGIPVIFFRSPDFKQLEKQRAVINRCLPVTKEIVQYIEPRKILVIGFS